MAFSPVAWAFKDLVTSTKLAQMVENIRTHDHRADGSQGSPELPLGFLVETILPADLAAGGVGDQNFCETAAFTTDGTRRVNLQAIVNYRVGSASAGMLVFVERSVNGGAWAQVTQSVAYTQAPNTAGTSSVSLNTTDVPAAGSIRYRLRAQGHLANGGSIVGQGATHLSVLDVGKG